MATPVTATYSETLMSSSYTDEQRQQAIDMYVEHGTKHTVETLGIPRRTILDWAKKAGVVAQADTEKTAQARAVNAERVQAAWGDYRENEALGAGAAAASMRNGVLEASANNNHQLLRARATAYGIFVDKAELLSGRATSRVETWAESELDRELRGLIDQMEDRIMADAEQIDRETDQEQR